MSTLTPELRDEIAQHLREMSGRESMIIRDMERGLTVEQIAASQGISLDNAKNWVRGTEAMLRGELPTAPSMAIKASRGYRYLLGCTLSPELRSYVTSCLRQLATINSEIGVEKPFRPGTLREAGTHARPDNTAREGQMADRPNVLFFHVDNLGYGELGCYGGGVLRGADTRRIDQFAQEGFRLLNYAPEAQCTPTRSALLTGRYSIRSGNHTVAFAGTGGAGLVAWERTLGDLFSEAGYATMCLGKWHVGEGEGRWPTDHGFDEWYGIPHSYDEALWFIDPWYHPGRDPGSPVMEGRKGAPVREVGQLTYEVRRDIDAEFNRRATQFLQDNGAAGTPFFLYFNHSLMHTPVVPRDEYKGKSGNGDWADSLLELDDDFGALLDQIEALGLRDNTIVVFAGDNGNEDTLLHKGTPGFFEGSMFTGMEGSLRTPCLVRWPGHVAAGRHSNEIMHVTDWFTTLLTMAGLSVPDDREIDGKDQSAFLAGEREQSNRDGFIFWNGTSLYGVKWQNFKVAIVDQRSMFDPALQRPFPRVINLLTDPKERGPMDPVYGHTWTIAHFARILQEFQESVKREPLIPAGAPLDHVPTNTAASPTDEFNIARGGLAD